MVCLKWLFLIIGLLLSLLFLRAMLGGPKASEVCEDSSCNTRKSVFSKIWGWLKGDRSHKKDSEYKSTRRHEMETRDGSFWSSWLPNWGCKAWSDLQERLRNLKLSVREQLPELPSVEAIRSNPSRLNVYLNELGQTKTETITSNHPPSKLFDSLNKITELGELMHDSSPEDLLNVKNAVTAENLRAAAAENALNDTPMADLRVKLTDLAGSHKNMLAKKQQISELRNKLYNAYQGLKDCERLESEMINKMESERQDQNNLKNELRDLESQEITLNSRINEKEKSLSEVDRQKRDRLNNLETKASDFKTIVERKDTINREINERKTKISSLQDEIDRLRQKIPDIDMQINNKVNQLGEVENLKNTISKEITALESHLTYLAMKEKILIPNKEIKDYLDQLVPGKDKASAFAKVMNEKIQEEKEMLEMIKKYGNEAESVGLNTKNDQNLIEKNIQKDREDFQDIMKKYLELQKVVDEFQLDDTEINMIRIKKVENEDLLKKKRQQLPELEIKKRNLDEELSALRNNLRSLKDRLKYLEEDIGTHTDWNASKQRDLADAERRFRDLQDQIESLKGEYTQKKESMGRDFGELDNERGRLRDKINRLKAQINEIQPRIKVYSDQLERGKGDCAALKAFYLKTAELIPTLTATLVNDKNEITRLKEEVVKQLNPFYSLG